MGGVTMEIKGTCPDCGREVGVAADDSVAAMFGSAVERLLDKTGNKIRCSHCQKDVSPNDMQVVEG